MRESNIEEREKERFLDFMSQVAKTEIHIHAEATVRPETYLALNKKYHIDQKLIAVENFQQFLKINSLGEMIKHFLYLQTFFKNPEDFIYMARDVEAYAKANNIFYMEVFISPTMALKNGVDFEKMLMALESEFSAIEKESAIRIMLIVDVSRTFGVENAASNLDLLLEYKKNNPKNKRCIGIGLGGAEIDNPARLYKKVFKKARQKGLQVVAHAGEEVDSKSIWEALNALKASRIGHGTSAIYDKKLMKKLKKTQVVLEICPSSNLITQKYVKELKDHPIKDFYEEGLMVTVNTDDPLLFDIQLNEEYYNMYKHCNFNMTDIAVLLQNNLKATFLKPSDKKILLQRMQDQIRAASLAVWGRTV